MNVDFHWDWAPILALVPDILQIAILYFAFYAILKAAKGSRFGQVLMGVGILFTLLIAFTFLVNFDVLAYIFKGILWYLAISTVVIFQPEIRRILATLGSLLFTDNRRGLGMSDRERASPEKIVSCIFKLAENLDEKGRRHPLGALIAFERGISLRGVETTGVTLDACVSPELLTTVFTPPTPLHDGGMIIRHGRIAATHCLFPVSANIEGLFSSGMRHRAAVGLSEETDALVIVVSEERGLISVAHNGRLIRYPDLSEDSKKAVLRWVRKAMPQQKTLGETIADWLKKRRERLVNLQQAANDKNAVPSAPAAEEVAK